LSEEGRKRFLAWERAFTKNPLPGVPAHIMASKLTWVDAELATGRQMTADEIAELSIPFEEGYSVYYRDKPLPEDYLRSLRALGLTPEKNPEEFEDSMEILDKESCLRVEAWKDKHGTLPPGIHLWKECKEKAKPIEEELPPFPQMFGSLHDLATALYPDIPYEFKIMAAVTHFGLIRSGLDTLESDPNLQPRFYTCFVAEPGRGKTAAINEVRNIFSQLSIRYSCMSSVDSGPALVDEFSERQTKMALIPDGDRTARVLLDCDEMRDLFEKSKISAQSRNSMFTEFLKLYESNRTGNRSRKAGKLQVENAHLAILAGATPEGYQTMWTGTAGGSTGLQSRFIVISTDAPRMPIERRPSTPNLGEVIIRLAEQVNRPGQIIKMEPEAIEALTEWWNLTPRDKPSEIRIDDMVKRLALVLAVSNDDTDNDSVSWDMMSRAIQFGDYLIACREKFNPADSHSWIQALENHILKVAQRHKDESMSQNDFRRLIRPDRKPGGFGSFLQAWRNVIAVGALRADGTTRTGHTRYKLE
jgi:hypothetical protein